MRYALYFSPPADDALTRTANHWLGRDAFADAALPTPEDIGDLSAEEHAAIVADPRRYGFHATLKAPFDLADGQTEEALLTAAERFTAERQAFAIPKLVLGQLGPFFALVPDGLHPPLQDFAAEVVRRFEPFRAPLSKRDIARRKPERLDPEERQNLFDWGYPYVFDTFRFHMTLTGPVEENRQATMRALLAHRFAAFVNRPLPMSHLAVFVEEERGAPFSVRALFPLKPAENGDAS